MRKEQLEGAHRRSRVLPDIQAQNWVALGIDHFHQRVVLIACSTHSSGSQCNACFTADALAEPQHVVTWVDCALRLAAAQQLRDNRAAALSAKLQGRGERQAVQLQAVRSAAVVLCIRFGSS